MLSLRGTLAGGGGGGVTTSLGARSGLAAVASEGEEEHRPAWKVICKMNL